MCSRCQKTRVELLRSRLETPARRRNSSAEWPGPSNSPAILAHPLALQTAANATAASLKPSAQAAAHREINLDSSPCTGKACCQAALASFFTEQSTKLLALCSQLRTRPRSQDKCLLMWPAILSISMLDTGNTFFKAASGLMMRPSDNLFLDCEFYSSS